MTYETGKQKPKGPQKKLRLAVVSHNQLDSSITLLINEHRYEYFINGSSTQVYDELVRLTRFKMAYQALQHVKRYAHDWKLLDKF